MLYSEIIAVCSQIHTKHINTLCGQNVEFWSLLTCVGFFPNSRFCRTLLGLIHKLWNKYKIGSTAKNSEYSSKHRGNICLAVGSTCSNSARYQLSPCLVSCCLAKLNFIFGVFFRKKYRNVRQIWRLVILNFDIPFCSWLITQNKSRQTKCVSVTLRYDIPDVLVKSQNYTADAWKSKQNYLIYSRQW
jgi:hypothetical protein